LVRPLSLVRPWSLVLRALREVELITGYQSRWTKDEGRTKNQGICLAGHRVLDMI